MDSKLIEEKKDWFRCPDTKDELMLVRRGTDTQYFVNKFETKFPVSSGFVGFVGRNSDKKVIPKYKPTRNTLSEVYEKFLTSGDFLSNLFNNLIFGKKMEILPFRNAMTVLLTELQGGVVLDMPVMTGQISQSIYANFPGITFVATDYQVDVLSLCYDRLNKLNLDNTMMVQADPQNLPFKNEIFDAVTSYPGINFMKNYKKALTEIFRVLKPGGKFAGTAFLIGENKIADQIVEKIVSSKNIFQSVFTMQELKTALSKAGFKKISLARFESNSVVRINAEKPGTLKKPEKPVEEIKPETIAPQVEIPELIEPAKEEIPLVEAIPAPIEEVIESLEPETFEKEFEEFHQPEVIEPEPEEPVEAVNEIKIEENVEMPEPEYMAKSEDLVKPPPVLPIAKPGSSGFVDAALTPMIPKRGRKKSDTGELDFTDFLKDVDFLQTLDRHELEFLWKRMKLISFPRDEVIIKQGEKGETFYIIMSGSVKVIAKDDEGETFLRKKLREGNFFGEMSLLIGEPRNATVIAAENIDILELNKSDFKEILKKFPAIDERISRKIAHRQKDILEKRDASHKDSHPPEKVKEETNKKIEAMSQQFLSRIRNMFPPE